MKQFVKVEFECFCNLNCVYCHAGEYKYNVEKSRVIEKMNHVFDVHNNADTFFE